MITLYIIALPQITKSKDFSQTENIPKINKLSDYTDRDPYENALNTLQVYAFQLARVCYDSQYL